MRSTVKPKSQEKPYKIKDGLLKELASKKLIDLIRQGKLMGPWKKEELHDDIYLSSVFVKEKDLSRNKILLLVDYSSPKGDSINSEIPPRFTYIELPRIRKYLTTILEVGPGATITILDLANAYYNTVLKEEYSRLFSFEFEKLIFIPGYMPFGVATGCRTLQKLLDVINQALVKLFPEIFTLKNKPLGDHYLDDECLIAKNMVQSWLQNIIYMIVCTISGFPMSLNKVQFPTYKGQLLGFDLDLIDLILSLKEKKAKAYYKDVKSERENPHKATLKKSKKIIGRLRYASTAIHNASAFIRQLEEQCVYLTSISYPEHKPYSYNEGALSDLQFWEVLLPNFNGIPFSYICKDMKNFDAYLFTDASGAKDLGCGGWDSFGSSFSFSWSSSILKDHPLVLNNCNNILEFLTMVLAVLANKKLYANKSIRAYCDNATAVTWLIKKSPKFKIKYYSFVAFLLRTLNLSLIEQRTFIYFNYIARDNNVRADALSKLKPRALFVPQIKPNVKDVIFKNPINPRKVLSKLIRAAIVKKYL